MFEARTRQKYRTTIKQSYIMGILISCQNRKQLTMQLLNVVALVKGTRNTTEPYAFHMF